MVPVLPFTAPGELPCGSDYALVLVGCCRRVRLGARTRAILAPDRLNDPFALHTMNPTVDLINDRQLESVSIGRGTYWNHERFVVDLFHHANKLNIGRYCSISSDVKFVVGGQHVMTHVSTWPFDHFLNGTPLGGRSDKPAQTTQIGSDVWIGTGAHIGGGITVGHGAVIGGGAVVMKDVPPYAIVIGNPLRILRYRFDAPIIASLLQIAWWEWSPELIASRVESFYLPIEEFVAMYLPQAGAQQAGTGSTQVSPDQ